MSRRPLMALVHYLLIAVGTLVAGVILLAAYGCLMSDRLIFVPPPPSYPDSATVLKVATPDGVTLAARHLPQPQARRTILYFHGNAEDLGQIEPFLLELRDRLRVAVVAWDYRGYGRSGGRPGEPATLRDAGTMLAWMRDQLGVPAEQVILFGRSLGGSPAVELAANHSVGGLVLEGTFTSAFRVMTGVRLLPFDKFVTLEKMPRVRCPVLIIHGTADEVVPFSHAQKLFAAAPEPKTRLWVPGARHNDLREAAGEAYWRALEAFVNRGG